jgi:hypothetical protein
MIIINIAQDYTTTPAGRTKNLGEDSGEEFRERFLEKYFKDANDNTEIQILLDNTEPYATSFLDEAFGALSRKFGKDRVLKKIKLVSNDQSLIMEIMKYINKS